MREKRWSESSNKIETSTRFCNGANGGQFRALVFTGFWQASLPLSNSHDDASFAGIHRPAGCNALKIKAFIRVGLRSTMTPAALEARFRIDFASFAVLLHSFDLARLIARPDLSRQWRTRPDKDGHLEHWEIIVSIDGG
ncbi:hypothetical protein MTsPCn3_20850 [Erythrobacter sp. MTPC3]